MIEFSDVELGLIMTILTKADPLEAIQDLQAVRRKISDWAQRKRDEERDV